jgi:hypothetical protein
MREAAGRFGGDGVEKICPLCNGMAAIEGNCPLCDSQLVDGGAVENYFGPYSPYMDVNSLRGPGADRRCVHLLYCPACGYDERRAWNLVSM